jgi:hypothetical protein
LRYLDLDYRLIQRQVKEELQLEKQQIESSGDSKAGLFESGTAEDRARYDRVSHFVRLQWVNPNEKGLNTTHAYAVYYCCHRIVLAELIRLEQRERDGATLPKRQGLFADRSSLLNNQVFRQEITTIVVVLTLRCRRPMIDIQVQIIQTTFSDV